MTSKGRNKPLADILNKASKTLARSRQLRDAPKPKSIAKTTAATRDTDIINNKTPVVKRNLAVSQRLSGEVQMVDSSSDDDDIDITKIAGNSPATFIEALDKYNEGMKSQKSRGGILDKRSSEFRNNIDGSESSLKTDLSSGTPSISLSKSIQPESSIRNLLTKSEQQRKRELNRNKRKTTELIIQDLAPTKDLASEDEDRPESAEPMKIPITPVASTTSFHVGPGHPHETVTALMRRGDPVSEETYRVLQMMVKRSDAVDKELSVNEMNTMSTAQNIKTDTSISMELEEDDDGEENLASEIGSASEILGKSEKVGHTMENIVENLMSLDLHEHEKEETPKFEQGTEIFVFRAENTRDTVDDLPVFEEQSEAEMTLKEYESDFEADLLSSLIQVNESDQPVVVDVANNLENFKVSPDKKGGDKSVTFSLEVDSVEEGPSASAATSKRYSASKSAIIRSVSEKSARISGYELNPSTKLTQNSSGKDLLFCPLKTPSGAPPALSEELGKAAIESKSKVKILEALLSASSARIKTKDRKESSFNLEAERKVTEMLLDDTVPGEKLRRNSTRLKSDWNLRTKPPPSKSRANLKDSKSKIIKPKPVISNPVEDLMNINGEKSTRHRQKILGILRKELYDKEFKRLNREQIKVEKSQKKLQEKQSKEDYQMFLRFKNSRASRKYMSEMVEWWKTKNPSTSSRIYNPPPPEIAQLMAAREKLTKSNVSTTAKSSKDVRPEIPNFGAPYFTRAGGVVDGNFLPPENMAIPQLVQEVLDSHHRMYTSTLDAAKKMSKKYKELVRAQTQNNLPQQRKPTELGPDLSVDAK